MAQRASRKRRRGSPATVRATKPAPTATPASAPPRRPAAPEERPAGWFAPTQEDLSRSQRRDAELRANLKPLGPGERPRVIVAAAAVAAAIALANLIAYLAGDKIGGKRPEAEWIIVFSVVLLGCAAGLWRMWYGAVLGFMALLAIIVTAFALLLVEASNVLGVIVALVVIGVAGTLFFKLVRVLSRIQMPQRPTS